MAMSKEDWAEVEKHLDSLYHPIKLDCDGYRLSLSLARVESMKLAITLHVNGWWKGEWLINDCEERRRFFRPIIRRKYKKNHFKDFSKKSLKVWGIDPDAKYTYYHCHWTNFTSLRRHLERNNKEITLIRAEEKEEKEAACA
jgi:hypothetical protein